MKSRGHVRLLLFFVALAIAGSALGIFAVERAQSAAERSLAIIGAVSISCAIGFAGVLYHRVRVIKARWAETEKYLVRIRSESDKYYAILEGAADMLVLVDARDGTVIESNAIARAELGLEAHGVRASAEAAPKPGARVAIASVVVEEDRARLIDAIRETFDGRGAQQSLSEIRLRGADGRTMIADARLAAVDIEDQRVVQVSLRDLTAQRRIEHELQIRERLSSIGFLTAGVAHEINNPLEAIGNYLSLIERPNVPPEQRARYVESLREGFARIREIVRDLLQFARPVQGQGSADLAHVVAQAQKLVLYSKKSSGVSIETVGLERPLVVVGDAGRLEQVVVNLLINAATASAPNGRVVVTAKRRLRERDQTPIVELTVDDDGRGIAAADLERIFDPFFTTTGGTGLGLSVSYGIISAHDGTLTAENRAGGGARFKIQLPAQRGVVAGELTKRVE